MVGAGVLRTEETKAEAWRFRPHQAAMPQSWPSLPGRPSLLLPSDRVLCALTQSSPSHCHQEVACCDTPAHRRGVFTLRGALPLLHQLWELSPRSL